MTMVWQVLCLSGVCNVSDAVGGVWMVWVVGKVCSGVGVGVEIVLRTTCRTLKRQW